MSYFSRFIADAYYAACRKNDIRNAVKEMKGHLSGVRELTSSQKKEIKSYWREKLDVDVPLEWHRFFYARTGIERPEFVPPPVYEYYIRTFLNPPRYAIGCQNKAYLERLLPDVTTVRSVVRNVNGRFLNEDFRLIPRSEAERIANGYTSLVCKPSLFSNNGRGVRLVDGPFNMDDIFDEYGNNWVLQIPIEQHEVMSGLNASSVNTVRVITVMIDSRPRVVNAYIKVGSSGKFADNDGNDRYLIGVRDTGRMADYAVDCDDNLTAEITSKYDFANVPLPGYEEMCRCAEKAHEDLAFFGFVAFDICIDKEAKPVIVEANLKNPCILRQVACGPFFGKYTDKVLDYVNRRRKTVSIDERSV